jgi:glucosamine--fructose-6-phosphate aminotransferase (isomerizing)
MPLNEAQYGKLDTWNEILSQGAVWQAVLRELAQNAVVEKIIASGMRRSSWLFVGCGTSYYLAEAAANSWTLLTGGPARAVPASEVLLYPNLTCLDGTDVQAVVISRSGKTSEAVRAAQVLQQEMHIPTLGITCSEKSELEASCDSSLILRSVDENSTVMTRSFTSMLISLQYLAALHAGNSSFPRYLQQVAEQFAPRIRSLAEQLETFVAQHSFDDYIFLGQGPFHGIAREAALKVMEMSCSYSQFFHTLEFRHGPKAIVSMRTCLMFFLSQTGQQAEADVLEEMKDLGGVTIAVCNKSSQKIRASSDLVLELDLPANELALLAPHIVPGQLLGFFTGVAKGLNPDQPKNLTRVVLLD